MMPNFKELYKYSKNKTNYNIFINNKNIINITENINKLDNKNFQLDEMKSSLDQINVTNTPSISLDYSDSISSLSSSEKSFSTPIFYTCDTMPAKKINNKDQINDENKFFVMKSSSNMCYLEIEKLKNAKYGEIVKAYQLYPVEISNTVNNENIETNYKYKKRQIVAIKKYLKSQVLKEINISQENPINEMSIMQKFSKFNCENIMNIIECMEDKNYYYMVLPFSEGGDIIDYINKFGPMNESKAKSFFFQLMNGINFMHEMGVAHRDLTSENVLCDYEKHTFSIIDFGACIELNVDKNGEFVESMECLPIFGKKNYIAPEVFNQDLIFFPLKVDVWSAGIILFIVLTGHPPVEVAINEDQRFRIIANKEIGIEYLLNLWNIKLNPEVIDLLKQMLDPNPFTRISSKDILNHSWLSSSNKTESIIDIAPQA